MTEKPTNQRADDEDDLDRPCPEPKPCPKPPIRTCTPPTPPPCDEPEPTTATADATEHGTPRTGSAKKGDDPFTLAEQLAQLQAALEKGQKELQKCRLLQTEVDDLTTRIPALQTAIAGEDAAAAAYTDFYRTIEVFRSELNCYIPTVRCQLGLSETQEACILEAISHVDTQIDRAQENRDRHYAELAKKQARQTQLDANVAWATKWNTFFATGLQAQASAQRDAIQALKLLVDPSKGACEAWFYLNEMDALLRSAWSEADSGQVCYTDIQTLGTFIDCWSPRWYATESQRWQVAFNAADAAAKIGAAEVAGALQRATELDAILTNLIATRSDMILQEIKTMDCCGQASKCQ
jgi:hypothetical protein